MTGRTICTLGSVALAFLVLAIGGCKSNGSGSATTQPATQPATGPATGPATEPTTEPATQPAGPPAQELTLDLGNNVSMKLVLIPEGKFIMGSPSDEKSRLEREGPQRDVTITKPFYMGVSEVTQGQYQAIMEKNPSKFQDAARPVDSVSWDEAAEFCKKLSAKLGKTVRLPTEAQWEYACRAGSTTSFSFGNDEGQLGTYAWFRQDSGDATHPSGEKSPNAWGLFDMHGNLWEWCSDWYAGSYADAPLVDPQGPKTGEDRVIRGGGWTCNPAYCRSAIRNRNYQMHRTVDIGFRVAMDVK